MNICATEFKHRSPSMLSVSREDGDSMPVTTIIPLPSSTIPVSRGIDLVVTELEAFKVNAEQLHDVAKQLDTITISASKALDHGDIEGVYHFLGEAIDTMREATLSLKLLCIVERDTLPGYVLEHLILIREIIQQAMNEAISTLTKKKTDYSSTA